MFLEEAGLELSAWGGPGWVREEEQPWGARGGGASGGVSGSGEGGMGKHFHLLQGTREPLWLNPRAGLKERGLSKGAGLVVSLATTRCCRAGSYPGFSPPTRSFS